MMKPSQQTNKTEVVFMVFIRVCVRPGNKRESTKHFQFLFINHYIYDCGKWMHLSPQEG